MTLKLEPLHPGQILREEFLIPLGITAFGLANAIRVPAQRVQQVIAERQAISADTDLGLCRFFGLSEGYRSRLQVDFDNQATEDAIAVQLDMINPLVPGRTGNAFCVPGTAANRLQVRPRGGSSLHMLCIAEG